MDTTGGRQAIARYIDLIAGVRTKHSEIAREINAANPGAKVAGTLVSRWRGAQLDVSPGNLAALARAYERNPLEAFVAAKLLTIDEAAAGLDEAALTLLSRLGHEPSAPVQSASVTVLSVPTGTPAVDKGARAAHEDEDHTIYDGQGHDDTP